MPGKGKWSAAASASADSGSQKAARRRAHKKKCAAKHEPALSTSAPLPSSSTANLTYSNSHSATPATHHVHGKMPVYVDHQLPSGAGNSSAPPSPAPLVVTTKKQISGVFPNTKKGSNSAGLPVTFRGVDNAVHGDAGGRGGGSSRASAAAASVGGDAQRYGSSSSNAPCIVWLRQDLRLDDNPALLAAVRMLREMQRELLDFPRIILPFSFHSRVFAYASTRLFVLFSN